MRSRSSRSSATLSRREVLRWGSVTALAVPLAACGTGYDDSPDPLDPLARAARADAEAARTLATTGSAETPTAAIAGAVASAVSRVRFTHADALTEEVRRANRPPSPARTPADRVDDLATLGKRLTLGIEQARTLATTAPRHRAGLLGSVAAGCAAAQVLSPELGPVEEYEFAAPSPRAELEPDTVDAIQLALDAEHAAIWTYGLVTAFLPDDFTKSVDRAAAEHRLRRDACQSVLSAAGATPHPAEPAYLPPEPVRDITSSMALVIAAETDATRTWRALLERTDDSALRVFALDALTSSAMRVTRWRAESGTSLAAVALPGTA